jgi:hypothetical protein
MQQAGQRELCRVLAIQEKAVVLKQLCRAF